MSARPGVVYRVRCSENGKVYIGSSLLPRSRKSHHFWALSRGRHDTPPLQQAYDQYGKEAFTFEILEKVDDHLFLTAREQFWMWRYPGMLFNRSPTAGINKGIVFSEATRQKHAIRMKGNSHRTGKPHPEGDRQKISRGLRLAILEGRKPKDAPALKKFQERIAAGEVKSPWVKQSRNDVMLSMWRAGVTWAQIGRRYNLDSSGVRKTILLHAKRMEADNVGR